MKEEFVKVAFIMQKIKLHEHQWTIRLDLKMASFHLDQQSNYHNMLVCVPLRQQRQIKPLSEMRVRLSERT